MIRLLSLFSGIGAFEKALTNLEIPYELVNYCEFDKYASKSFSLIHNVEESLNLGDITQVDEKQLPPVDMITYGFPCQDISLAGKQKGFTDENGEKTRSGLFFDALRIITHTHPKIAIAENVKNLTSKRFTEQFQIVLSSLEDAGYNNYWKVLNSKDFGIPHNRERLFIISIRKDIDTGIFEFPHPFELKKTLKDFLEKDVDESFAMADDKIRPLLIDFQCDDVEPFNTMNDGTCRTIKNQYFKNSQANFIKQTDQGAICVVVRTNNKKGYEIAEEEVDSINFNRINSKTRRGRVGHGVAQTLDTSCEQAVLQNFIIRKLTPKECFRLQGFSDYDHDVCANGGISRTQLYKQIGNSITVDVMEEIYCRMFDSDGELWV